MMIQNTTSHAKSQSTADLWASTHGALCNGRWSEARARLEVLAGRHDVRDQLASVDVYGRLFGNRPLPEAYRPVIQDRIDAVNRVASR